MQEMIACTRCHGKTAHKYQNTCMHASNTYWLIICVRMQVAAVVVGTIAIYMARARIEKGGISEEILLKTGMFNLSVVCTLLSSVLFVHALYPSVS